MRRKTHSKAGLFLIELMISILFFAITAAVFLQVFAKSNSIRNSSAQIFQAQTQASNIAELLKAGKDAKEILLSEYPHCESGVSEIRIYYDEGWKECEQKDKGYIIDVTWEEEDDLRVYNINACDKKREVIYDLQIKQWLGDRS